MAIKASLLALLDSFFPPGTAEMKAFREDLLAFIRDPLGKVILLEGPSGIGKTLTARLVAIGRCLTALPDEAIVNSTAELRRFVRTGRLPDYFVEFAVTGLVESLADAQLFGTVSGAASDIGDRLGVFEQAMYGRPSLALTNRQVRNKAVTSSALAEARTQRAGQFPELLITGGVVFLDEIADVPTTLQAKLLRVLNRDPVSRVGGEGNKDYEYIYEGMVIGATNADLEQRVRLSQFRDDLLYRFQRRVRLPGLAAYNTAEAFREVIRAIVEDLNEETRGEVTRLGKVRLSPAWEARLAPLVMQVGEQSPASPEARPRSIEELDSRIDYDMLSSLPWSRIGEFRALRDIVRSCLAGLDFRSTVATVTRRGTSGTPPPLSAQTIATWLGTRSIPGESIGDALSALRRELVLLLRGACEQDPAMGQLLAQQFGVSQQELSRALKDLARNRSQK
jgi:MoxR-like ATPase